MPDPLFSKDEMEPALDSIAVRAKEFLEELDRRPVRADEEPQALGRLAGDLPDEGLGPVGALDQLSETVLKGAIGSAGPRFFHFVVGGATPAALAADWLTSALDQNVGLWPASPTRVPAQRCWPSAGYGNSSG